MPNLWVLYEKVEENRTIIGEIIYHKDGTFDIMTDSYEFMSFFNNLADHEVLPCKDDDESDEKQPMDIDTEMNISTIVGQKSEWKYLLVPIDPKEMVNHEPPEDGVELV